MDKEKFRVNMVNCEAGILAEIANLKMTQKSIALSYAFCLKSSEQIDFKKIHAAILARWKPSALERIKNMAWGRMITKGE